MKKNKSTNKFLTWFDQYILELVAGFLLVFLPLYPKWPLLDVLPGYIVRIRLEDFVIATALLIFLVQVIRKKVELRKNPIYKPIVIYWVIGFLSALSAILITRTVPAEPAHMGKLFLHWARRIEYMSVALIFFSAIKSKKSLIRIILLFLTTSILVSLYGLGQKYLSWPVYSTMNREFAKGWRLVLTQHARVSSTFAGHYDLAAWTVPTLSLTAAMFMYVPKKQKPIVFILFILLFATLLLTASRTSFIAYVGSIGLVTLLAIKFKGLKKATAYLIFFSIVSLIGLRSFGTLYSRFAHVFMLDRLEIILEDKVISKIPDINLEFNRHTQDDIRLNQDLKLVYTETDTPPTPVKTSKSTTNTGELPPDVYEAIPENFPEASLSAVPATSGTGSEGKSRTYSETAFTYGLSSAIRFDALWPRALEGFKKNPLLGSGYSTLTKVQTTDFTEAESTDNDYLRTLGETGLLGLIAYFGIVVFVIYKAFVTFLTTKSKLAQVFLAASISGLLGIMVNALYIDVFEASKVAYTVWALIGVTVAVTTLNQKEWNKK